MHVKCKKCGCRIPVAGRPKGSTKATGVKTEGNVRIDGGGIALGPGGSISFGPGGSIGFGAATKSQFACPSCQSAHDYAADEIVED